MQGLPPGTVVRIVNEHGIVVAQSENGPDWIGRDLSDSEQVARHLAVKEANEVEFWTDHVRRITGSSTAHQAPWLVTVGLPMDVALATLVSRLRWGAALGTSALIAAFAIAWMFSGRIVRPLQQLEKDASVLAAGALSHRSAVRTRDEVGNLADTFNRMATSLERRQYEAQQSNDTLSAVIDASPVAIVCSDLDRRIMLWSRSAERLYGYTAEETLGTPIKIVPPEGRAESRALYERALNGESIRDVEARRRRKDGSFVDVRIAAAPMYHPDGTVRGVAWAHEDITARKRAEEQLKRLAHYDPLTGLPNRLSLQKELERLLSADCARPTSIALFDLDGFKDVNDTLGHSIGDQLLIEVGQRLIESTERRGETDQVFRLGGDEFVVIVADCGDPRVVGESVDAMLKRLAEPFRISEQALHLGGSAGVAIAPNDGATVDDLIANADLALYQAKSEGGRTYRLFMPILRAQAQARRGLDLELRRAFAENEFELYFQPEIRLRDRTVVGAEALLRWRHPERGILAPWVFIDTLANSSIAPGVGRWIIHAACAQAAAWRAMGLPLGRIGVNLFPAQLHGDALLQDIDRRCAASKLARARARARDHGERGAQLRGRDRAVAEALRSGREARVRRFRHRLCFAELPDALPALADQDRPQLRAQHHRQYRARRHRALADRHGAQSQPGGHRRRGRDGSASGIPARAGVRGGARLSLRQAAAGRRVRGLSAGRTARIPNRGRGQATARRRGSPAGRRGAVP